VSLHGTVLVWVTLASGCRPTPELTELMVVVDTDFEVPGELDGFNVRVLDGAGREARLSAYSLDGADPVTLPASFGVVPQNGDADRRVAVEVDATFASEVLFTTRAVTGFIEGKKLRLEMFLAQSCMTVAATCGENETCRRDGCADEPIDPEDLPEFGGGDSDGDTDTDSDSDSGVGIPTEEAMLLASDGAAYDIFGSSVALSSDGGRALVGAYEDDTAGGTDAGSARVFLRTGTTWTEEATLVASGGPADDHFGQSVVLSSDGSRALVGAYGDASAGSARVFLRAGTTWSEEATLLAADGAAYDMFGYSVALSSDGSRALVGAYAEDTAGGTQAGSARAFLRMGTTWTEEATLLASDGARDDFFGRSVALSSDGGRALVGVVHDDPAGGPEGSARVFLRTGTTWTEEATLLASDGAQSGAFGDSVALSSDGSRALVGAFLDDTAGGSAAGSARVFLRTGTTWSEEATLLASDGAPNDYFGNSVALSSDGSRALVGALRDATAGGSAAGSARLFLRTGTTWTEDATLLASDGAADDAFGASVALSSDGSRALVGAGGDDTAGGSAAGSAWVFLFSRP